MSGVVKTSSTSLGDVFKNVDNPAYSGVSGTFRNNSGAERTISSPAGLPVKLSSGKWVPVMATDEANVGGLLFYQDAITDLANNTDLDKPVTVIVRGPAIVNRDKLPTTDPAGASYNLTTLQTALEGLSPPIVVLREPQTTQTQTT